MRELDEIGYVDVPSAYDNQPYRITKQLIHDGRKNLIFGTKMIYNFPIWLFQLRCPYSPIEIANA